VAIYQPTLGWPQGLYDKNLRYLRQTYAMAQALMIGAACLKYVFVLVLVLADLWVREVTRRRCSGRAYMEAVERRMEA